ncbi:hypothetical protein GJ496_000151 [Pomphorhynchus laevis]|nr:hypothetical protein GJ496_000151 [Pomphorhynchus laevis]
MSVESDKLLKAIASRKSRTTERKYANIISKLRLTISIRIAKSALICIIRSTRNADSQPKSWRHSGIVAWGQVQDGRSI